MAKKNKKLNYTDLIQDKKVPILTLDARWHALFSPEEKTFTIRQSETEVNQLLKRQGKLINDIKELKALKKKLMAEILNSMPDHSTSNANVNNKMLDRNKSLIEEINVKIDNYSDELGEVPYLIRTANEKLMIESMKISYEKIEKSRQEIEEIGAWIEMVREKLKKNIIHKQELEDNNTLIYSYMHDVLGSDIMETFDKYEERLVRKKFKKSKKSRRKQ